MTPRRLRRSWRHWLFNCIMDRQYLLNSYLPVFSPVKGLVKDGEFDIDGFAEYCRASADAGANGIRILPYAPWGDNGPIQIDKLYCPYRLDIVQRAWNLDLWDEGYFTALRRMVEIASEYNVTIWFSLFDNCQFHHGGQLISPWAVNVQGVSDYFFGDEPEPVKDKDTPSERAAKLKAIEKYNADRGRVLRWVDKVHATVGNDALYPIGNELSVRPGTDIKAAARWAVAIFDRLLALGVPERNITLGAMPSATYLGNLTWKSNHAVNLQAQILTALKDRPGKIQAWRVMHNVGIADEKVNGEVFPASYCGEMALAWWGGNHEGEGFISDDGVIPRPDATSIYNCALRFFQNDGNRQYKWAFEHCPKDYADFSHIRAISTAYRAKYGVWPENYEKFPNPQPPTPPTPTPDPPQPEPEKPPFNWKGWWNNNKWYVIGGLVIIALAILVI